MDSYDVARKATWIRELEDRYPEPDASDPFLPLSVLRERKDSSTRSHRSSGGRSTSSISTYPHPGPLAQNARSIRVGTRTSTHHNFHSLGFPMPPGHRRAVSLGSASTETKSAAGFGDLPPRRGPDDIASHKIRPPSRIIEPVFNPKQTPTRPTANRLIAHGPIPAGELETIGVLSPPSPRTYSRDVGAHPCRAPTPNPPPPPPFPSQVSAPSFKPLLKRALMWKKKKKTPKPPSPRASTLIPPFDEHALPTMYDLASAANHFVVAENGVRVRFGDLWGMKTTVVLFIRHFWCPLCQDYMTAMSKTIDAVALQHAGVDLVIISNGSHKMIKSYRRIFKTPFAVYTDTTLELYKVLGMTLRTLDGGNDADKGDYVKHGTAGGIGMVVVNAVKARVPVWEKGGEIDQLGGEFVLGPGLQCSFTHRMPNTRNHAPISRVLEAAGFPGIVVTDEGIGEGLDVGSACEIGSCVLPDVEEEEEEHEEHSIPGDPVCSTASEVGDEGEEYHSALQTQTDASALSLSQSSLWERLEVGFLPSRIGTPDSWDRWVEKVVLEE